ncbi:MAG: alpha/beta fold hydrolase [Thermomicrobiales bacterium]|nr:alpha/beta fold hydrolase [Thermomicrobiales bacterium]
MDQYRVRHGGANLYVETHGPAAGPPVLLLHGGIGSADDWAVQVPALVEAGYRVVAMDCRARGRSTWGEAPLTFAGMTADVLAVLDALGIAQADLIGWSDGAIIGLHLAINHRERLRKLVLYGGLARCDRAVADPVMTPGFEAAIARLSSDYLRLSPQPERFSEVEAALFALYAVAPDFPDDDLRGIATPTLVLDGAEEELILPGEPERMAALIPGARLVIMPGTGHFAPFEQPEAFNRVVLEFLGN